MAASVAPPLVVWLCVGRWQVDLPGRVALGQLCCVGPGALWGCRGRTQALGRRNFPKTLESRAGRRLAGATCFRRCGAAVPTGPHCGRLGPMGGGQAFLHGPAPQIVRRHWGRVGLSRDANSHYAGTAGLAASFTVSLPQASRIFRNFGFWKSLTASSTIALHLPSAMAKRHAGWTQQSHDKAAHDILSPPACPSPRSSRFPEFVQRFCTLPRPHIELLVLPFRSGTHQPLKMQMRSSPYLLRPTTPSMPGMLCHVISHSTVALPRSRAPTLALTHTHVLQWTVALSLGRAPHGSAGRINEHP